MNIRQLTPVLLLAISIFPQETAFSGGWGRTFAIEISGEALAQPIVITDPSVVEALSFWVGPGTGYSEFMGPVNHELSIVAWDRGEVSDKPGDLARFQIRFLLEPQDDPPAFIILYEPDPENDSGYIYYPERTNSIVTHFAEGTWRHASAEWNDKIGWAIAAASELSGVHRCDFLGDGPWSLPREHAPFCLKCFDNRLLNSWINGEEIVKQRFEIECHSRLPRIWREPLGICWRYNMRAAMGEVVADPGQSPQVLNELILAGAEHLLEDTALESKVEVLIIKNLDDEVPVHLTEVVLANGGAY